MKRPNPKKAIADSVRAAKLLMTVGTLVEVVRDIGPTTFTWTTSAPWALGHGAMVVNLHGIKSCYDCARVTPLEADRTEWTEITFEDQGTDFTRWFLDKDRVAWCDFHGELYDGSRVLNKLEVGGKVRYDGRFGMNEIRYPIVSIRVVKKCDVIGEMLRGRQSIGSEVAA